MEYFVLSSLSILLYFTYKICFLYKNAYIVHNIYIPLAIKATTICAIFPISVEKSNELYYNILNLRLILLNITYILFFFLLLSLAVR